MMLMLVKVASWIRVRQCSRIGLIKVQVGGFFLAWAFLVGAVFSAQAGEVATSFGISFQVNVDALGQNIRGDAANEPSMCIDPTNSNRMAIGWRQFDTVASNFRQSGWAYSTNGGRAWTFPGKLDAGVFRSDPVLAADANGWFYYLGITNANSFFCDLFRSTNGGISWESLGWALGGDKEWMAIDTTTGPGRGNIYQVWSPFYNYANDQNMIFTRSTDGGRSWMNPMTLPHLPYFGTLDVGPNGEVYIFGMSIGSELFVVNRSTNARDRLTTPTIDQSVMVDLGGPLVYGLAGVNPVGLLGQAWIAVDRSSGSNAGNVYVLSSVTNDPGNLANVMFSRSTDGGTTWSAPIRINDDSPTQNACHWFGTLSVAPNGRVDACWNDTRHSPTNAFSELYYSWSEDGGLTWAPNRPLSPPFNHSLGYPMQNKMGDYIAMVSLDEGACIAYTATFNGEQDIYFVRAELPITATITLVDAVARISWNSVPGVSYCVQSLPSLSLPWSAATNVACVVSTTSAASIEDSLASSGSGRFYRVIRQP
jgi:hypothetical protein